MNYLCCSLELLAGSELRRITLPRTWVNKGKKVLMCLLALRSPRVGMQPQRDVRGLHRLPYHPHQILLQRLEVRLVPQLDGEGFQGLPGVVLAAVEAAVNEGLDAPTHRVEERRYREGGDHHGQLRLLLLSGEEAENCLYRRHAPEVDGEKRRRKRPVDEGAVDDDVYVVEPIAKNGYPHGDRNGRYQQEKNRVPDPLEPEGHLNHVGDDFGKYEAHDCCGSGVSEPLDLLALYPCGPAQAHKH